MRINIRLTGVLFGIVFLARIGEIMLYAGRGSRYRRRSKDDGGAAFVLLGIGLVAIGLIGGFFGSLIRAAVSRQREFLADAAAVQFTRNPDGIAGALKRIGGFSSGSNIGVAGAKDFSHMFFGSAMSSMFATHPPLPVRIKRIEPNWKNTYPDTDEISEQVTEFSGLSGVSGFASGQRAVEPSSQTVAEPQPAEKSESARTFLKTATVPGKEEIDHARNLLAGMPPVLLELAKEPFGARCVIFSLLLDLESPAVIGKQLSIISEQAEPGTVEETEKIRGTVFPLNSQQKFVLVEEAAAALSQLSADQFTTFQNITETLIGADEKIDLLEWSLRKVIDHDFGRQHSARGPLHGRVSIRSRLPECSIILGALAHYGQEEADPTPAFEAGIRALDRNKTIELPPVEECGLMNNPKGMTDQHQRTKLDYLNQLNQKHLLGRESNSDLDARIRSYELAFRMQSEAPEAIDLDSEPDGIKSLYGLDHNDTATYGRQCLMARRLVERGVRFIQLYHGAGSKWDSHSKMESNHTRLCGNVDQPIVGLITDLKQRGLLDETLVIWGGEFGRTPMSEKGDGRDHNPTGFTMWMAGGGVKGGQTIGATDELGLYATEDKMHVHDIHATTLGLLGLDHTKVVYMHKGRPERVDLNEGHVHEGIVSGI